MEENGPAPDPKRRRHFSKSEALQLLKAKENEVQKVADEMCAELVPFDVTDEEALQVGNRLERMQKASSNLERKIRGLLKDHKDRKYRHNPERLEEDIVSCSQYSVFQSDESQDIGHESESALSQPGGDGDVNSSRPSTYSLKPLNHEMTPRSRRRRVEDDRMSLRKWAVREGVSVVELLGYLLYLETTPGDKGIAGIGWKIFTGEKVFEKPEVSLIEATWMIEKGHLSQVVFQEYRLRLLDRITLPPVNKVATYNKQHRPTLTIYSHGVKASLGEVLSFTISERVAHLDFSGLDSSSLSLVFSFGWGLDGSGDHSNYHQISKKDFTTKQVMSVCFSLKTLVIKDSKGAEISWTSTAAGSNKPQNVRPLALFPAKEEKKLLQDFIPDVENEIAVIKEEGLKVKVEGAENELKCECNAANLTMIDGKMANSLLQLNSAFCTMCSLSQEKSQQIEVIEAGFKIDRSIEQIGELALSLLHPDTGEIMKKKGDYEKRQGITGIPITKSDLTKVIPVCHSKIRSFEFVLELLKRCLSHKKWKMNNSNMKYTEDDWQSYKASSELIKDKLYDELAINVGNANDMVTGHAFQRFSSDQARRFICSLVDEEVREDLNIILLGLCVVVKVINSQQRKVNVEKLQQICKEVNLKLVTTFPWAAISPSVHRILAHSPEVIQLNNGYGLGDGSEEGLEALNKYIRSMREHGARKVNTESNFEDVFNHLWDRSRPSIVEMERVIRRQKAKVLSHPLSSAFKVNN